MKSVFKLPVILMCLFALSASAHSENAKTEPNSYHPEQQYIKVALLLDTSNSMDGLIDQAKAQLWEIVNELSYAKCGDDRPDLQIALYEYGNDGLNSREGYIRQVLGFSEDLDEISKQLFSLTTNGGSEFCGHVIHTSLKQLDWGSNPDDLKLIFIAGNEPFTQGRIDYRNSATNANEKDVTVNTIYCGDYQQGISSYWKDGADRTGGDYMAIDHNQATVHIASPYDDTIIILNKRLNDTYIYYGSLGEASYFRQSAQDKKAGSYSEANEVSRAVSKSSRLYKNSSWDLVDAVEDEVVEIDDVRKDQLPEELKNKSTEEIKIYVAKKAKEREKIQKEIQELNEKRRVYIAEKQKESNNGLQSALMQAIKKQAKEKNYDW